MQYTHFHTLKPLCPACVAHQGHRQALELGTVVRGTDTEVEEGTLVCSTHGCGSVYPIIDGIPILVADLAHYLNQHAHEILWRRDLGHTIESCIGDALGAGVVYDNNRHYLSAYVDGHFRDKDLKLGANTGDAPVMRFLETALSDGEGPFLDVGCSVGRVTYELGEAYSEDLVLGVDLNFTMLRFARALRTTPELSYPRKRVGVIYDEHHVAFPAAQNATNVDFWACDGCALPFQDNAFGQVMSLNLLDCVPSPTMHLTEILRLLTPGAKAYLATPFDWSAPVTPMSAWLGGHSQHNEWRGESSDILFETLKLLEDSQAHGLAIQDKRDIPWEVRIHERNTASYRSLLLKLEKVRSGGER